MIYADKTRYSSVPFGCVQHTNSHITMAFRVLDIHNAKTVVLLPVNPWEFPGKSIKPEAVQANA